MNWDIILCMPGKTLWLFAYTYYNLCDLTLSATFVLFYIPTSQKISIYNIGRHRPSACEHFTADVVYFDLIFTCISSSTV